jgi:hypothetical protein
VLLAPAASRGHYPNSWSDPEEDSLAHNLRHLQERPETSQSEDRSKWKYVLGRCMIRKWLEVSSFAWLPASVTEKAKSGVRCATGRPQACEYEMKTST